MLNINLSCVCDDVSNILFDILHSQIYILFITSLLIFPPIKIFLKSFKIAPHKSFSLLIILNEWSSTISGYPKNWLFIKYATGTLSQLSQIIRETALEYYDIS